MTDLFSAVPLSYAEPSVRLADVIAAFLGKVEVVLAGADEDLRISQEALAAGDGMAARAAAHRVLDQAPDSPLGLALLADACELAHLDAELALTLEELARRAPSSAEVWVRLARARQATGSPPDEVRDPLIRALAVAQSGSDARVDALIGLADLDLAQGDAARAELWIERAAPFGPSGRLPAGVGPFGRKGVGHCRAKRGGAAASWRRRRRESRARRVQGAGDRRPSGPREGTRSGDARRRGRLRSAPPCDGARYARRERGAVVRARLRAERRADADAGPVRGRCEGRTEPGAMARGIRERRGRARRRAARPARGRPWRRSRLGAAPARRRHRGPRSRRARGRARKAASRGRQIPCSPTLAA